MSRVLRLPGLTAGVAIAAHAQAAVDLPVQHVIITQVGNTNEARIEQSDSAEARLLATSHGDGNRIIVRQQGVAAGSSAARIDQTGSGNLVDLQQTAHSGSLNEIVAIQAGTGNEAQLVQDGSGNLLDLQQRGDGNQASLSQTGSGLSLSVQQAGGANIIIRQIQP